MANKTIKSSLLIAGILILGAVFVFVAFAQEINPNQVSDYRAKLEAELAALESEIGGLDKELQEIGKRSTTLERDIAIADAQIAKSRLQIKARDLAISRLSEGVAEKTAIINRLEQKLDWQRVSLGELLRRMNEMDAVTLTEVILGYESLSDFFTDFSSFEMIQNELQISFSEIKNTQNEANSERETLEEQKNEQLELKAIQELEKKKLEKIEADKKQILKVTKGEEAKYQKLVKEKQKSAAAIRTELFMLRGSSAIPFEKAVEYATFAWRATGVRPAFLLGVIAEESNLGANVGTGNWKVDMAHSKCTSQREAFIKITSELGLNPDVMPVSRKAWYGYCGGAMGPAQFMPTTWILYKSKISELTGSYPPNPWEPKDAFVASALLLKDNGAAAGGYTAERRAALKYLAGSNWNKPSYAFYGDDVMDLATKYQGQIDIITGN
jgi:membrane-bound lytic murein transglycosylase B